LSLAARLAEKPKPKFEDWLAELPKADRDALEVAALDIAWPTRQLMEAIAAEGYRISLNTLMAWRRGRGFTR